MITTAKVTSDKSAPSLGGQTQEYLWHWQGQPVRVVYETVGQGTPVLLLPAFSTVSTRAEMAGLAKLLAPKFQVIGLDWPGFGQSDRLPLDYQPAIYHQFLADFTRDVLTKPLAVVAAGHAAGYAMKLAHMQPDLWSRIVLVAPTWRGPLPTMGANQQLSGMVREIVRSPILGQFLYKLNTAPSFLKFMYRQHVYSDPAHLTASFIQQKWEITQQPGARFAPAAFVTGNLDPARARAEFLQWFEPLPAPVLAIVGEQAPPKSKAEMEALAQLPGVQTRAMAGSLGLHEEYPVIVGEAILGFLA
ncbi:MAG: alpha/beta hydrolase [Cyanosarcina radialis HA8281-LM2]|nr:alpha/beta hydrolase [Cyanosarcina radialis HA8281-LM2]